MLGMIFALLSAFSFSLNVITIRRGVASASSSMGVTITVIIGVPMFLVAALVTGQLFDIGEIQFSGYLLLALAGVIHFGIGRWANYRAISAIGATRVGPIRALTLPYTLLIAFLFLGEEITLLMGAGIALILIGPAMVYQRKSTPKPVAVATATAAPTPDAPATGAPVKRRSLPAFTPKQGEGYFFGLMGSLAHGTTPIIIRHALADSGLGIAGGFIAYAAAGLALALLLLLPGRFAELRQLNRSSVGYFVSGGTTSFLAQMFRFMALSIAPVSIVTPLQRTASIFSLFLSFIFNRSLETFSVRIVAGVLLSVAGTGLLLVGRA
jgi:drug/metabolite transporter (DMT)-like permease